MQKFNTGDKVLYSSKNSYIWTVESYCEVRKVYFVNDGSTSYGVMALEEDLALYVKAPEIQSEYIEQLKVGAEVEEMPKLVKGDVCPFSKAFDKEMSELWQEYDENARKQLYSIQEFKKCKCNIHELMRSGCLCGGFQNESKSK